MDSITPEPSSFRISPLYIFMTVICFSVVVACVLDMYVQRCCCFRRFRRHEEQRDVERGESEEETIPMEPLAHNRYFSS